MQQPQDAPNNAPSGISAADPKTLRMPYWKSVGKSLNHIREAVRSEGKRVRQEDVLPIICIPALSILLAVVAGDVSLTPFRPVIVLCFALVVLHFIFTRIGVIRNFTPRETHLVVTMMLAMFMLGVIASLLLYDLLRQAF